MVKSYKSGQLAFDTYLNLVLAVYFDDVKLSMNGFISCIIRITAARKFNTCKDLQQSWKKQHYNKIKTSNLEWKTVENANEKRKFLAEIQFNIMCNAMEIGVLCIYVFDVVIVLYTCCLKWFDCSTPMTIVFKRLHHFMVSVYINSAQLKCNDYK